MTQTTQTLTWSTAQKTKKPQLTPAEEKNNDILSVCDSLYKLHETLSRLDYAVKRKKIEKSLTQKNHFIPKDNSAMKLKYKQSAVMLIVFVVILTTVFSVLFLNRTTRLAIENNAEALNPIANAHADYWQSLLEKKLTQLYTLAHILESYGSEPAEIRQYLSDNALKNFTSIDDEIVTLYTVWKPNAVDGVGQYTAKYSRESEQIAIIPAENTGGRDAYLLKITAPILNSYTDEVIGNIVCAYDLAMTQKTLEELIAENNYINAMEIYTSDGYIAASHESGRIGKNLRNVEPLHNNMRMVLKPFTIGNATWTVMAGATDDVIMRVMKDEIWFMVIVALIAIITASVAIFIIFNNMIKPIDQGKNGGITTPTKYNFLQRSI